MNKATKTLIDDKITDLTSQIHGYTAMLARVNNNEAQEGDLSKNTCSTQIYACKRERRVLGLIKELYAAVPETFVLSAPATECLSLITTLKEEKAVRTNIELHEGDSFFDLMMKHQNIKGKRWTELIDKAGLVLNSSTGKLEVK